MQRVKLYRLTDDGQWDDQGTGHVSMDFLEQSEELGFYVTDEDDRATFFVHRISAEDIYTKQNDAVISWRDKERSEDLALSFQETAHCSHLWNHITNTQRFLQFNSLNSETFHNVSNELELPNVDLSTLPQILKIVTEMSNRDRRRLIELILKDDAFFPKLTDVFEACETANNVHGLHVIFNIVKGIISLNSSPILQTILGEELIMKIIGCLEYNPDDTQSQNHRNYLREHVVFKEAIQIKDPLLLSKIKQTYLAGYLKDVVLNKVVDGTTSEKLKSVIEVDIATVVTRLRNNNIVPELSKMLRSPSTSVESRNNLVDFLHELCRLCENLLLSPKLGLFGDLVREGIFDIIAQVLQSSDKKLVLTGTSILGSLLKQDDRFLGNVLPPKSPLLAHLVKAMKEDFGEKMQNQIVDLIRSILESGDAQQRELSMKIFCEEHIPGLVDFITASCPENPGDPSEDATPEVLLNICEFLCFCVQLDPSRKNFFLNMTQKVLLLTRRKEKPVVAAAIRFLRNLLSDRDDNVQSYIVQNNTLKPIIDFFVAFGHLDNLVNSAILELLEHIRKGESNVLLKYVVETFWDHQLAPFKHLPSIQALKTKYDIEVHDSSVAGASSASPSKRFRGLVDYDDDEDDDEEPDTTKRWRASPPSEEDKNSP